MTRALAEVPMPARIARLPRNQAGYPIPFFVSDIGGVRDFRIASGDLMEQAVREKLCWVCGQVLGANMAFPIGPMCAVNRISSEPPTHLDCAVYSVKVCPFLSLPGMRRRPIVRDDTQPAAGEMIERNPGVALIWVTRSFKPFRPPRGHDGVLFQIGDPVRTLWFREGRPASRDEIVESIQAGLPALQEACQSDENPDLSLQELAADLNEAMLLVPAQEVGA